MPFTRFQSFRILQRVTGTEYRYKCFLTIFLYCLLCTVRASTHKVFFFWLISRNVTESTEQQCISTQTYCLLQKKTCISHIKFVSLLWKCQHSASPPPSDLNRTINMQLHIGFRLCLKVPVCSSFNCKDRIIPLQGLT